MRYFVMLGVCAGLLAAVTAARADERSVDIYDTHSNRTGYAVVDTKTGRVDIYDAYSRRVGWGMSAPGRGTALYDLHGHRSGTAGVLVGPALRGRR